MSGSKSAQCQANGKCDCNGGYTGVKCETRINTMIEFVICNAIRKDKFIKAATCKITDLSGGGGVKIFKSDDEGNVRAGPYYVGQKIKMEVTSDDFDKYSDEFTIVKNMPSKRIPLNPTVSILDILLCCNHGCSVICCDTRMESIF